MIVAETTALAGSTTESLRNVELVKSLGLADQEVARLNATTEFKRALAEKFRSTLWDRIEDRGDSIAIIGRGYGHGAGLCQVGAYEMARDGKSASEILEHYFPSAKVQKLY